MNQMLLHYFYSLKPKVWVTGAVALSLFLAINNLGLRSFWWDETYSVYFASMEWAQLWDLILHVEANQSLYFILLKLWVSLGDDEFTVRLFSVIFSTASIPIMYLVGRELMGQREGIIAAIFLSVNSFFIYYAQEARGYSLLLFLILCSSYFAIRSIKKPSWKSWAGFTLFSVLATYAHFFAVWIMLAQACSLPFLPRKQVKWKEVFFVSLIIVICLLPLLGFILRNDMGQISWIPDPTINDILYLIVSFASWPVQMVGYILGFIINCIYIFLCIAPLKYLIQSLREDGASIKTWGQVFAAGWFFLPVTFVYLASLFKPMFQTYYLIIALPGFILLVTSTLTRIDRKWLSILCSLILILTTAGFTLKSYSTLKKEDWREMAKTVETLSIDQDAILFYQKESRVPFDYYYERINKTSKTFHYINNFKSYDGWANKLEVNETFIKQVSERHQRLWLVLGHSDGNPDVKAIKTLMEKYFIEKKYWSFYYQLYVYYYVSKEKYS
jgi:mannosyltransferase